MVMRRLGGVRRLGGEECAQGALLERLFLAGGQLVPAAHERRERERLPRGIRGGRRLGRDAEAIHWRACT